MSEFAQVLGIFAKQPVAGTVKTRLARVTSADQAARIAEAFLEDTLARVSILATQRVIAYAPAEAGAYFARWRSAGFDLSRQGDGDLGERLRRFFRQQRQDGFPSIVVIGTDSPTLPTAYIEQAFASLATHDVVLGPAMDGGYYLIGSRREIPMFEGIPWSTSAVLERTVAAVRNAGASLAMLPPWYDVDTVADWNLLRGHVQAMRLAGADPAIPNTERVIREQLEHESG